MGGMIPPVVRPGVPVALEYAAPEGATAVSLYAAAESLEEAPSRVFRASVPLTADSGLWNGTLTPLATWAPGPWSWQLQATANGAGQVTANGSFVLGTSLAAVIDGTSLTTPLDLRSQTERDLDAVDQVIRDVITAGGMAQYSVAGRQVQRMSLSDLRRQRALLRVQVSRERQAAGLAPLPMPAQRRSFNFTP